MFPKSLRIKKSSDFKLLFTKGKSFHSPQLKLQVLYGGKPGQLHTQGNVGASIPTKYAVITPKGVGKAHDRNRIRRQLLAQLRAWHEELHGKIGSASTIKKHISEDSRDMFDGSFERAAEPNTVSNPTQRIAMLAIYVKVQKDSAKPLADLASELKVLLMRIP